VALGHVCSVRPQKWYKLTVIVPLYIFSLLVLCINKYLTFVEQILPQPRTSSRFRAPEISLALSQTPIICTYPDNFDVFPSCYFKIHFNISLPCTTMPSKQSLSFGFPHQTQYMFLSPPPPTYVP